MVQRVQHSAALRSDEQQREQRMDEETGQPQGRRSEATFGEFEM